MPFLNKNSFKYYSNYLKMNHGRFIKISFDRLQTFVTLLTKLIRFSCFRTVLISIRSIMMLCVTRAKVFRNHCLVAFCFLLNKVSDFVSQTIFSSESMKLERLFRLKFVNGRFMLQVSELLCKIHFLDHLNDLQLFLGLRQMTIASIQTFLLSHQFLTCSSNGSSSHCGPSYSQI